MPCLGTAGSITAHHVRAVHGSATNFSGRERRFLLFQYRAADAWPLLGFKDGIEKFDELLLAGEPTLHPRLAAVPVRLPLPPAEHQGSIYENQRASGRRFFATAAEVAAPAIAAEWRGMSDDAGLGQGGKPRRSQGGGRPRHSARRARDRALRPRRRTVCDRQRLHACLRRLSDGWLDRGEIECPLHAGRFDVKTGKATAPPCTEDLKTYPIRLAGDEIQVKLG